MRSSVDEGRDHERSEWARASAVLCGRRECGYGSGTDGRVLFQTSPGRLEHIEDDDREVELSDPGDDQYGPGNLFHPAGVATEVVPRFDADAREERHPDEWSGDGTGVRSEDDDSFEQWQRQCLREHAEKQRDDTAR